MANQNKGRLIFSLLALFIVIGSIVELIPVFGISATHYARASAGISKALAANNVTPLSLISQNVPSYSNDPCYPPSYANDNNYDTHWLGCNTPSTTKPTWLAYDMSHALNGNSPSKVLLAWFNDPMSGTITNFDNPPSAYNNIGAYTIDVNPAPGGATPPTTGWITLVTVTNNFWNSRQHLIDMSGNNWIRINVTAPNGTPGNMGVAINMDIYDASQVPNGAIPPDDWIFLGDSITAAGANHASRGIGTLAQLINQQTTGAYYPVQQTLGLGGTDAAYGASNITSWLPNFPGKYVTLDYGTNDANGCGVSNTSFYNSYITMIQAVLNVGKVPIIPFIPWAPNTSVQQCAGDPNADPNISPHLNAVITQLYNDPTYGNRIVRGPNMWATFYNQPNLFQDSLHPTETQGYGTWRNSWVSAMLANVYSIVPSTPTPTSVPTITPTPNMTPTLTPSPTPTPTPTVSVTPSPTTTLTPTPTPTPTNNVTLFGTNSANGNFGAGVKIKIPALQSGDLLLAVTGTNGSPSSWATPAGWYAGTNSGHPDGQGLKWWWKIASGTESGSYVTLKASSYTDGGGVVLDYRGTSVNPIQAVSSLATNDNGGRGHITSAVYNSVVWSGTTNVVNLLLMSWQPNTATVTWPGNYTLQATANDGYSFVAVGANLTTQSVSSFPVLTATFSTAEAVIPTLQIAILTQ